MKRKSYKKGLVIFALFVVMVIVGGYTLNAAGYIDSPFDQIAFLSNWVSGGEQQFEQRFDQGVPETNFSLPSLDTTSDVTEPTSSIDLSSETDSQFSLPPLDDEDISASGDQADFSDKQFDGGDEQNNIQWNDIGDVFFNLWYIAATAVVFIIVQQCIKFIVKQAKSLQNRAVGAR